MICVCLAFFNCPNCCLCFFVFQLVADEKADEVDVFGSPEKTAVKDEKVKEKRLFVRTFLIGKV